MKFKSSPATTKPSTNTKSSQNMKNQRNQSLRKSKKTKKATTIGGYTSLFLQLFLILAFLCFFLQMLWFENFSEENARSMGGRFFYIPPSPSNASSFISNCLDPSQSSTATVNSAAASGSRINGNGNLSAAFNEFLSQVPFERLSNWTMDDYDVFFTELQHFSRQEPLVPINATCQPPPLISPDEIICNHTNVRSFRMDGETIERSTTLFQGKRITPAKIGHAIQFGSADVDTLEIHLSELYDVVDYFFIVEFVVQHNQLFPTKQLTWDHVKKQNRFRKFQDKIVHIILDDVEVARMKALPKPEVSNTKVVRKSSKRDRDSRPRRRLQESTNMDALFETEKYQERLRWKRIQEWNEITQFFKPDDVIGFGDADEIASRHNVQILKYCKFQPKIPSIDIGIWFPYGKLDQAFASDFPVRNSYHEWTLGDPTFWTYGAATNLANQPFQRIPSRNRGMSPAHLLGGMHMSHYPYLPYLMLKYSMATESDGGVASLKKHLQQVYLAYRSNTMEAIQDQLAKPTLPLDLQQSRIQKLNDIPYEEIKDIVYVPWFYDCNRNRYPRWEGRPDSRIGI